MPLIDSRDKLKDYILRKLGYPVININVDDAQIEDRIGDALQLFTEQHFDGVERRLIRVQVSETDIANQEIDLSGITYDVMSITRVLEYGDTSTGLFDIRYQLHMQDYFGLRSGNVDLTTYDIAKQYVSLVGQMLNPEKAIQFSKVTDKLRLDTDWTQIKPGNFLVLDVYIALNPEQYTKIFDDPLLKELATAMVRYQWGQNLSKFSNMTLVGGVVLNGDAIMDRAERDIAIAKQRLKDQYQYPVDFFVG